MRRGRTTLLPSSACEISEPISTLKGLLSVAAARLGNVGPRDRVADARTTATPLAAASLVVRVSEFGLGVDEPNLVGVNHRLDTVAQPEFHEHPPEVGLHGRLRNEEPLGDLSVGVAAG
jgi:hypothetical protein